MTRMSGHDGRGAYRYMYARKKLLEETLRSKQAVLSLEEFQSVVVLENPHAVDQLTGVAQQRRRALQLRGGVCIT